MKDYFEAFRFKIAPLLNRRTVTARWLQVSILLGMIPNSECSLNCQTANFKQPESYRFPKRCSWIRNDFLTDRFWDEPG
jgi:hypothetical protein